MRSEKLSEEFQAACLEAIQEAKAFGYNATVWLGMIHSRGAVDAAKHLLESGDIQPGFERLVSEGRLDLTVEMAVLHPRWDGLFEKAHREAAWWRLGQALRGLP